MTMINTIKGIESKCVVALQNPPVGASNRRAARPFFLTNPFS